MAELDRLLMDGLPKDKFEVVLAENGKVYIYSYVSVYNTGHSSDQSL